MEVMKKKFPKNVAIIMDGNGRWAQARGLPRTAGHKEGIKSVDAIISAAVKYDLQSLVLYAFSSENWKRPKAEVSVLMGYLSHYLDKELPRMQKQNICFDVIGRVNDLPDDVVAKIIRNKQETQHNTGLRLILALSYGGRHEIIDAVKKISASVVTGILQVSDIDELVVRENLYLPDLPDPDLLIRTSGEMRISNFLLWQISYTEFYITHTLWPDFREEEFVKALSEYSRRDRRFGS